MALRVTLKSTVCRRLAEGESLRKICVDTELPAISTVMGWLFDGEHDGQGDRPVEDRHGERQADHGKAELHGGDAADAALPSA